ncbi:MAG: mechanosensitive ion channel family protein [Alphaproteobacteria bacterium]
MMKWFFILCLGLGILAGHPALAQGAGDLLPGGESGQENSESLKVDQESISELIQTLESESAREEFIQNLKTLSEAKGQQDTEENEASYWISRTLGIEDQTKKIIEKYEGFLAENNLTGSALGQMGLSALVVIIALIALYFVRKGSYAFESYLSKDKQDRYEIRNNRFHLYAKMLRLLGYIIIAALAVYSLLVIWNVDISGLYQGEIGPMVLGNFFSILVILAVAVALWEVVSGALEHWMYSAKGPKAARMKTLLPVAKNVLFFTFIVLFGFVILSELGINVVPLMAGAGIAGIAIGFGAQTMVSDFINGFMVIFEDLFRVGDVVRIGDRAGLVEKITIRKVQLRDLSGTVYTIPFSEVKIVENLTKDFSYYLMDVGVAYRENTDEVVQYLKEIDEEMRGEKDFKDVMLEPIEILGVDQFTDSAVIVKARLKTIPIEQWRVGREFNRRMKFKFDEQGIEIPFPHQTLYFGQQKDGTAPPAPVRLLEQQRQQRANDKGNEKDKPSQKKKKA